jgi:hypothetical protein
MYYVLRGKVPLTVDRSTESRPETSCEELSLLGQRGSRGAGH